MGAAQASVRESGSATKQQPQVTAERSQLSMRGQDPTEYPRSRTGEYPVGPYLPTSTLRLSLSSSSALSASSSPPSDGLRVDSST